MKKTYVQPEFTKTKFVLTQTIATGSEGNGKEIGVIDCKDIGGNQRNHVNKHPYNCQAATPDESL